MKIEKIQVNFPYISVTTQLMTMIHIPLDSSLHELSFDVTNISLSSVVEISNFIKWSTFS
jgi:hypothetical protein